MSRKSADDYSPNEILEWVGGGPNEQGIWHLTKEQVGQFPIKEGIVHCPNKHRYTKWNISEHGAIRWERASRSQYEAFK